MYCFLKVHSWKECSISCGGGLKNRDVDCVNIQGDVVDSEFCSFLPQPAPEASCNTIPCPECESDADCLDAKVCSGNQCVCPGGYFGINCGIQKNCKGFLSPVGECCPSGIFNLEGHCCQEGMVQSRNGNCCPVEDIDPCGICNGSNQV